MSLDLDDETREQLGYGKTTWPRQLAACAEALEVERAQKREAHVTYEQTEGYRIAHRRAALAYYHRNKSNPRVRVRKAS